MKIGYCLTGSFCTFAKSLEALEALVRAELDGLPSHGFSRPL